MPMSYLFNLLPFYDIRWSHLLTGGQALISFLITKFLISLLLLLVEMCFYKKFPIYCAYMNFNIYIICECSAYVST
jgi:hypothetical protein